MNKPIQFHALTFEQLPDGTIRMKQPDFSEDCIIDAHPEQIRYIARKLCGMKTETAERVQELERRLAVLADKFQDIVCSSYWRSEILERMGDGLELLARLDALVDLCLEYDGGRLRPEECAPVTDSVTPPVTDLGTPANAAPPQQPHPAPKETAIDGQQELRL